MNEIENNTRLHVLWLFLSIYYVIIVLLLYYLQESYVEEFHSLSHFRTTDSDWTGNCGRL